MSAFEQAFAVVVGTEGGYVNNPADPGGETKFGISKRAYPHLDIGALELADAHAIYRRDYWDRLPGDSLAPPLALLAFDAAVNNGLGRARQWLAAAAHAGDGAAICAEFTSLRLCFMAALPTWKTFGHGWSRRLCRLPYQAVQMGDA